MPYYQVTLRAGPAKVVEMARDAGIRTHVDRRPGRADRPARPIRPEVRHREFDNKVGIGQYPITVLDHANGMATIANRGVYHKAHFIQSVEKYDQKTGEWVPVPRSGEQLKPKQVFPPEQMDDLNSVLKKVPPSTYDALANGREAIGKTGTWELNSNSRDNGDAWMIGATPQIAAAVWVGTTGARRAIREVDGSSMFGGGTPAAIWKLFMDEAHAAMKLKHETFPEKKGTGDPDHPLADGVPPPAPPTPREPEDRCDNPFRLFCPPDRGPEDRNNGDPNEPTVPTGPNDPPGPGVQQPGPGGVPRGFPNQQGQQQGG